MYVVEIIQQFTTSLHPTLPRNVLNADTDVSMQECTLDLLFLHRDSGTFLACYGLLGQTPLLIGDRELHSHGNYISQAGDAVIQSEKKLKKKKKKSTGETIIYNVIHNFNFGNVCTVNVPA